MAHGGTLLIVEDNVATPSFPYIQSRAAYAFTWNDDVYYWTHLSPMQPIEVENFVSRGGTGYPTNAFSIQGRSDSFTRFERVTEERLIGLARATNGILVSAYDAESFVLWSPVRLEPEQGLGSSTKS